MFQRRNKENRNDSITSPLYFIVVVVIIDLMSPSELILGRVLEVIAHPASIEQGSDVIGSSTSSVRGSDHFGLTFEDVSSSVLVWFAPRHGTGSCATSCHWGYSHVIICHLMARWRRWHAFRSTGRALTQLARRSTTDSGRVIRTATQYLGLNVLANAFESANGPWNKKNINLVFSN